MVAASIYWMMNEFEHANVSWVKRFAISIHPICIDSHVILEIFVQYGFSKLISKNIILFKECKYVSPQKLTFLVQNTIVEK
jgi:hypothetical protein